MVEKRKELYVQIIIFYCFKNNVLQKWPHGGVLCEDRH